MRISQEAKDYEKAAAKATPAQAFQAGMNHERSRQAKIEKLAARSVAAPKVETPQ